MAQDARFAGLEPRILCHLDEPGAGERGAEAGRVRERRASRVRGRCEGRGASWWDLPVTRRRPTRQGDRMSTSTPATAAPTAAAPTADAPTPARPGDLLEPVGP